MIVSFNESPQVFHSCCLLTFSDRSLLSIQFEGLTFLKFSDFSYNIDVLPIYYAR